MYTNIKEKFSSRQIPIYDVFAIQYNKKSEFSKVPLSIGQWSLISKITTYSNDMRELISLNTLVGMDTYEYCNMYKNLGNMIILMRFIPLVAKK